MRKHRIRGYTFLPNSSKKYKSELIKEDNSFTLKLINHSINKNLKIKKIFDSNIEINRKVFFTNNYCFEVDEYVDENKWNEIVEKKNLLKKIEKFSINKSIVIIFLILLMIPVLKNSVPFISSKLAFFVPHSYEEKMGEILFKSVDKIHFEQSKLVSEEIEHLEKQFINILNSLNLKSQHRIYIRYSEEFGANAFAFPGGIIVITDDLINVLKNDDLIVAAICHELAHSKERHALKNMLSLLGFWYATEFILFGLSSSIIDYLINFSILFFTLEHSRALEIEADRIAVSFLKKINENPLNLIRVLKKLEKIKETSEIEWLSTHPNIDNRIELIEKTVVSNRE